MIEREGALPPAGGLDLVLDGIDNCEYELERMPW
jgi:hypothetical protein